MCYGYDALNRIRHIRYGNGVETAYTYDGDGNVRTLETRAGKTVLLSFAYRYDGNGNRTAKTGTQATLGGIISGSNVLDISYAYDVRGQLLEERRNGASVCYAYDKAENRIRKTDAQGEIRYLYNAKNQLITEESPADRNQFSYDRQGGIIEEKNAAGIRLFSYNSRRQQTRVETETGSVQENRYDAEGLRFELLENGRRTSFVYHDGELLQEEGREEQKTSYHLGAGMEAFRRGQELSYYHRDEQLSTVFVTDGQGEIRNSYQYDAFGIPLETTEQLNNRIRYTGQQYDELTEQYYLRARYYNPSGYKRKACPPQGKISESVDEGDRKTQTFDIVEYGDKTPGLENHHGVLDVWATHNIDGYKSRASRSTTIALTPEQHAATKSVYRDWLYERTGNKVGGKVDWTSVSPQEVQALAERMFDAANVPLSARNDYYREFNRYIYGLVERN